MVLKHDCKNNFFFFFTFKCNEVYPSKSIKILTLYTIYMIVDGMSLKYINIKEIVNMKLSVNNFYLFFFSINTFLNIKKNKKKEHIGIMSFKKKSIFFLFPPQKKKSSLYVTSGALPQKSRCI